MLLSMMMKLHSTKNFITFFECRKPWQRKESKTPCASPYLVPQVVAGKDLWRYIFADFWCYKNFLGYFLWLLTPNAKENDCITVQACTWEHGCHSLHLACASQKSCFVAWSSSPFWLRKVAIWDRPPEKVLWVFFYPRQSLGTSATPYLLLIPPAAGMEI